MSQLAAIITCRHRFVASLLAVVSIIAFHQPMNGEAVDSLYHIFLNASTADKPKAADAVLDELRAAQATDNPLHYSEMGKAAQADTRLHYLMSEYYYNQEQFEKSLQAVLRAKDLLGQVTDLSLKSDVLCTLANTQFRLDEYDEALVSLLAAYKIDRQLGDDKLISSDLNTLAAIYLAVHQPQPGIPYIEKAIALERKLNRPDCLAIRLGMASELYLMNGDTDKALKTIQEAYRLDSNGGREEKAAIRKSQMAAVLEKTDQLDEARALLNESLDVLVKVDNTYSIAVCHNQLGVIAQKQGRTADAVNHFKQALEQSIQCGSAKQERNAERGLWETMREDNPTVAMLHLERYATLSDSLRNRTTSLQMKVMDATLQEIEQTEANDTAQRNHRFFIWAGTLMALLLTTVAIALFRSWRRNKKALQLQRQNHELRSHFLSNITRELHTPLTLIMGAGQQLRESPKATRDENKRIGEIIVSQGNNMLEMINKLIDIKMVRDDDEKPDRKDGDIVLFTRLLVSNFTDEASQKGIRLDFTSPVNSLMVSFVPDYIRTIIHNLISNAIKFTPPNGSITVDLTPLSDEELRFTIADTGKGIPREEMERIFEPFTQSVNGDDGVNAALNLSLTHHLVKTLNGTITVESKVGQGTTFTITLPSQLAHNEAIKRQKAAELFVRQSPDKDDDNALKPLIFIVENDDAVAYLTASHLRDNYNLRFLSDGEEAYDQIQAMMPDLVITSIRLSPIDGKELINRVRSNEELKHIPMIAVTSVRSDQERISCLEAGANAVLVKPFNTMELRLEVKHLLDQRIALRERFLRSNDTVPEKIAANLSKEDQQFIIKFVDTIYAQMAKQETNMDHIAAAMSVSRNQLRSRVMAITGMSPMTYALQVRLNYARRMIINDEDLPLTTIAAKCGFQSLPHFSNSFKQQFGMRPTQYRKNQL